VILSGFAVVAGVFPFVPGFASLLPGMGVPPTYSVSDLGLSAVSVALGAGGILTAYSMWGNGRVWTLSPSSPAQSLRTLLLKRYYVKIAYDAFGLRVVYTLARAADFVDQYVIDGTVKALERAFGGLSDRTRRIQSGVVLDYAGFIVGGLVALLVFLLVLAPWVVTTWGGAP
jgi:NADH-quinone oxidoreductase subunit L